MIKSYSGQENPEDMALRIISSLGRSRHDFDLASQMYTAKFFKDESDEFRAALCRALVIHFSGNLNVYWNKYAGEIE